MNDVKQALGPMEHMLATIAESLPRLGLAALVLVIGLIVALIVRRAATSIIARLGLDGLAERAGVARILYALQIHGGVGAVIANLASVLVVLVTLSTSAEIAGLPGVADGVGSIVEFLPRLVSAAVVALFGFAAAEFASRVAEGVGRRRSDLVAPKLAANIVYYVVLAVVLTTAVQHLGMVTDLIDLLMTVLAAAVTGGVALAFAWASRQLLQDVLSRPYACMHLECGTRVTVGEVSGELISLDTVTVSILTEDGRVAVLPYRRLLSEAGFTIEPGET